MSRIIVVLTGTAVLTLSGGTSALTLPGGGAHRDGADAGDPDTLARASAAALTAAPGGRVTEIKIGGEESYCEVEVTLDDGRQLEVQLDAAFAVVGRDENEQGDDGDAD